MTLKLYASLSEAIREGAKLRPQTTGNYFDYRGSCALGAALEVCLGYEEEDMSQLAETYPYLRSVGVSCPVAECKEGVTGERIEGVIPHLNDDHRWTREAIADWLETEEEKIGFVTVCETEPVNEMTFTAEQMESQDAVSAFR